MTVIEQDLWGNSCKTLFVIGNGFDLHHGFKTSFSDFWSSKCCQLGYYQTLLESTYTLEDEEGEPYLWSDLEYALGYASPIDSYNESNEDEEIDEDHPMQSTAALADRPAQMLSEALTVLHESFEKWVKNIEIDPCAYDKALSHLGVNDLYLCFNYSETLELLYHIPRQKIAYIHGRRNSDDVIILGHSHLLNADDYRYEENMFFQDEAYEQLVRVANEERKDTSIIIRRFWEFWNRIKVVDRVVVYGLSYGEVDLPYLDKIREMVAEDTLWHLSYYTEIDKAAAEKVINTLGIRNAKVFWFGDAVREE